MSKRRKSKNNSTPAPSPITTDIRRGIIVFCLGTLSFLFLFLVFFRDDRSHWVEKSAVVVDSEFSSLLVQSRNGSFLKYYLNVEYSYYEGQLYNSQDILSLGSFEVNAKKKQAQYSPDTEITIFIDPENPARSSLHRKKIIPTIVTLFLSLSFIFMVGGFISFIIELKKVWKLKNLASPGAPPQ